jgi:hypothetical protein
MIASWNSWSRLPEAVELTGIATQPGVYEVRDASTGRVVACGHARSLASALRRCATGSGVLSRLFDPETLPARSALEYRMCPTHTAAEAELLARRLIGLRHTFWQNRKRAA